MLRCPPDSRTIPAATSRLALASVTSTGEPGSSHSARWQKVKVAEKTWGSFDPGCPMRRAALTAPSSLVMSKSAGRDAMTSPSSCASCCVAPQCTTHRRFELGAAAGRVGGRGLGCWSACVGVHSSIPAWHTSQGRGPRAMGTSNVSPQAHTEIAGPRRVPPGKCGWLWAPGSSPAARLPASFKRRREHGCRSGTWG